MTGVSKVQISEHDSEKEAAENAIDVLGNLRENPRYEFVGYAIVFRLKKQKYELTVEYIDHGGDEAA